jgi:hypothetical protein
MPPETANPALGAAAGLGNASWAGSLDDPEINRPDAETSLIAQWSLEDGDETGAGYALTRLVAHAAAAAQTSLDIVALKMQATPS